MLEAAVGEAREGQRHVQLQRGRAQALGWTSSPGASSPVAVTQLSCGVAMVTLM